MIDRRSSVTRVPQPLWDSLLTPDTSDLTHAYLAFREVVEPGPAVVLTASGPRGLLGAVHATERAEGSGLFSDPWKLLAAEQFLRLEQDDDLRVHHRALAEGLSGRALVVRGFDHSTILLRQELSPAARTGVLGALIAALQEHAGGGTVALPYVAPGDEPLRAALAEAGFVRGLLTAASWFELSGHDDLDGYLGSLPSRFRRNLRTDLEGLAERGEIVTEADPDADLERVVELEALTTARHGGRTDHDRLLAARRLLVRAGPRRVRLPAVRHEGRIVACGVHYVSRSACHVLGYGAEDSPQARGPVYHWLTFTDPVAHGLRNGLARIRLGFEALEAKHRRGALVEGRETWLWCGDPALRGRLAGLLALFDERNTAYLSRFQRRMPCTKHHES